MNLNTPITNAAPVNLPGWIGFDANCPFCCRLVQRWRPVFEQRGFMFLPLQHPVWKALTPESPAVTNETTPSAKVDEPHAGLPTRIDPEFKVRSRDHQLFQGAAAWCYLARQVGWLKPLGVLGDLPGLRPVTRKFFAWVARNRFCLGEICLPNQDTKRHQAATTFLEFP